MYYPLKKYPFVIGFSMLVSSAVFSQTNKPDANSHLPTAQSVASTPAAYNVTGQAPPVNYVRARQALGRVTDVNAFDAAGYTEVGEITQYVDGLGRPMQTVMRQATPGSNPSDIVAPITYDEFGREVNKYLSYAHTAENNGLFKTDPFNAQAGFYQNVYPSEQPAIAGEQVYYSQVNYEASPLNRPLKSLAPGNSWAGSNVGIQQQYMVNTDADAVELWDIGNSSLTYAGGDISTNIPSAAGVYGAGQLYKNVTKDEQGNAVVEYKDKQGRIVLKKVQSGAIAADYSGYTGFLCTYYIYDIYNQLRFVIPPKAVAALAGSGWDLQSNPTLIKELCFRYEYDTRNRMIAKKIPGADWVYMVYDKRDRLMATQDSYTRARGCWLMYVYDNLNRQVMTGFYYPDFIGPDGNPNTAADFQTLVDKYFDENATEYVSSVQPPPYDLYVAVRHKNDAETYQYVHSVTFTDEFAAGDLPELHTEQVEYYEWVNSYTKSSGNFLSLNGDYVESSGGLELISSDFNALTITHYDNYDWTSQSFTDRYNSKLSAGNNLHAEVTPSVAQQAAVPTLGLPTGTEVRIMPTTDNILVSSFRMLYTIPFYDDRGRVIQTQSNNYKNGVDIATNMYDFTGKVLSSYLIHTNLDANMLNLRVETDMEYDAGGRLLKTWKTVNDNAATKTLIAQNEYDALGKLKRKSLGQKKDINGVYTITPIETLDYSYNIRGWLKGINGDYAANANNTNNWFGMQLDYDYGFDSKQVNGNIAGIKWRSAGDGEQRAYGFGYDAVNRLMYADFNQLFGSAWLKQDPNSALLIDFSAKMGDGADPATAYDENGNIKAMKQWGLKLNTSDLIDDLKYTYADYSNKLQNVKDFSPNASLTKLGDFKTSASHPQYTSKDAATTDAQLAAITDYVYDANGNMTKDYNKDISSGSYGGILYNYLNLPVNIGFVSAREKSIEYTYDASGSKLSKSVREGSPTTTDYIGALVYQNNVLQFISDEEGRIRYKPKTGATPESFVYDYFIKDHLGNVRMVLTDEQQVDVYPAATLEDGATATENTYYAINTGAIVSNPSSLPSTYQNNNGSPPYNPNPTSDNAATSTRMYRLNGAAGDKTGLGITLKVMAGDNVDIFGKSFWHSPGVAPLNNYNIVVDNLLASLAGTSAVTATTHGTVTAGTLTGSAVTTGDVNAFLSNAPSAGSKPKAYINWILFDEHFKVVNASSGFDMVDVADQIKPHHQSVGISKNGYLYVYCSNESNVDVFFDNLQVVHTRGPLLEETHYYPFGLIQTGISSHSVEQPQNKLLYNGKEKQSDEFVDGGSLEWYDYGARMYDQQIGRWMGPDPLSDQSPVWSCYAYTIDNPIRYIDPDGMMSIGSDLNEASVDLDSKAKVIRVNDDGDPGVYLNMGHSRILVGYMDPNKSYKMGETYRHYGNKDYYIKNPQLSYLGVKIPDPQNPDQDNDEAQKRDILGQTVLIVATEGLAELFETGYAATKGISVIGPRATYRQFAKQIGARFLNVTDEAWTWAKNEKFLAGVVKRGDDVIFAGKFDPTRLEPNSVLAQEIKYLIDRGYQWSWDFYKLVKP